jgi:hypothetical protein
MPVTCEEDETLLRACDLLLAPDLLGGVCRRLVWFLSMLLYDLQSLRFDFVDIFFIGLVSVVVSCDTEAVLDDEEEAVNASSWRGRYLFVVVFEK